MGRIVGALRHGGGDPTWLTLSERTLVRAFVAPTGPATLELTQTGPDRVEAKAWGAGAQWALESVPDLLGEGDDDSGFVAHHPLIAEARKRFPDWRVPRSGLVIDTLVPVVIEQKVTGQEAFAGYRTLVRRFGAIAPGPYAARRLMTPPSAAEWRAIPSWAWRQASVDAARSDAIMRALQSPQRLEALVDKAPSDGRGALMSIPGIGVWTAAEVAQRALGDADAVSFGDYHVAKDIGYALTGKEVDDDALAELLEPYAGHRFRVQALLSLTGIHRPRRGPRMAPRTHLPTRPNRFR